MIRFSGRTKSVSLGIAISAKLIDSLTFMSLSTGRGIKRSMPVTAVLSLDKEYSKQQNLRFDESSFIFMYVLLYFAVLSKLRQKCI